MTLNQFLKVITEKKLNSLFYYIVFFSTFLLVIIYMIIGSKKFKIPRKKAVPFTIIVYAVSLVWMFVLCWAESGFKNFGGNNIVRVFVWVPLVALPVSKLFKIDWEKSCDYLAPCVPLMQTTHWGCIFAGCCHGYPCSWGIYNPVLNENTFPNQILEALVALCVVINVWRYIKKRNFDAKGLAYPLMLILFGYSRFLLEFLRDNEKLIFGISSLAFHALFMALVGTAAYFSIDERNKKRKMNRKKTKNRRNLHA